MSHILMLDNYDSFTYNLVQAFLVLGADVTVRYNDELTVEEALDMDVTHLVVSPGPGRPEDAGIAIGLVQAMATHVPILGVCLGHQVIAAAYGGTVGSALDLMHGKPSEVYHDRRSVFAGVPNPFSAGRYHSLAVFEEDLPDELVVSAFTSDGEVMGLRHRELPIEGVQFHPESVLTPAGERIMANFIGLRSGDRNEQTAGAMG